MKQFVVIAILLATSVLASVAYACDPEPWHPLPQPQPDNRQLTVVKTGEMRTAPGWQGGDIIGYLCEGGQVEFLGWDTHSAMYWYKVRVVANQCGDGEVLPGTEGWLHSSQTSMPVNLSPFLGTGPNTVAQPVPEQPAQPSSTQPSSTQPSSPFQQSPGPQPDPALSSTLNIPDINFNQTELLIQNDSPYPVRVTWSGPESRTITLPACQTCSVYSLPGPSFCRPDAPYEIYTLPTGTYTIVAQFDTNVLPNRSTRNFTGGYIYYQCFYVVQF
ncbi:MAG: hypothetical protein HC884_12770 [Chloroflexaceae bacterium]|nr:hypothetical protein [Chloroflexaceae bacterium]